MRHLLVYCMLMTYLTPASLRVSDAVSSRDMHVWRGEFEHALSAEGGTLDRAAYLALAGDLEGSLELLDGDADSLRHGILAYRTGRFDEAMHLLIEPRANPYLEAYRVFYRASALAASGNHAEAAREFAVLIGTDVSTVPGQQTRELFVEASYRAGAEPDSIIHVMGGIDRFHGVSALMLSDLLLVRERIEEAGRAFLRGLDASPDTTSDRLFVRLYDGFSEHRKNFDRSELGELTECALNFGEFSIAHELVERMESDLPGDYRTRFLRGTLYRAEKKPRIALRVFDEIFESGAPIEIKRDALLECASIEYEMGRYELSAKRYRLFGLYYPDDRRSSYALDLAARIYVSQEMFDRALDTWERLRERGAGDSFSREAVLSEAAMRLTRGDSCTAYHILKDLLARVDWRDEPAVLYWLHRSAGTESEREAWKRSLSDSYPCSFYRAAAEEGERAFTLGSRVSLGEGEGVVGQLERREHEFVESVKATLRPNEDLYRDGAYEALVYFLECGFLGEARSCVGLLERRYGSDAVSMAALYATVRSSGLVDLGLKLLWTKGLSGTDSPVDHTLRYPVAYSSFVAKEAARNGLPDELLLAVIREESSFDRFALSRAGALGLMQLMPRTGSWIGRKIHRRNLDVEDLLDPEFNIAAGAWYLRYLLDRTDNSVVAALAAYNGGEKRLSSWRESFDPATQPLFAVELIGPRETRRYVKRVLDSMSSYRRFSSNDAGSP